MLYPIPLSSLPCLPSLSPHYPASLPLSSLPCLPLLLLQSQSCRVLQSVVLFDALATDFAIVDVWCVQYGAQLQSLHGAPAQQGAGLLLGHTLSPQVKVQVKVSSEEED